MGAILTWCGARGRGRFVVTLISLVALTGAGAALLIVPNATAPGPESRQPPVAAGTSVDDPRLSAPRRIMEPFGAVAAVPVTTGDGGLSLVVGHSDQRAVREVLERELPVSEAAVTALWGPGWARSAVVVVASNPSEFAALVRSGALLPGEVAAVTVGATGHESARIVFSHEAGRRLSDPQLRALLRHELTHIATRADTSDGAPRWMTEGFAEYAAHRGSPTSFTEIAPTVAARSAEGRPPTDLPADTEFRGAAAALSYEIAWSACAFVAATHGDPALVELYRRMAAGPLDAAGEDRVLREVLDLDRTEFLRRWRAWLPPAHA